MQYNVAPGTERVPAAQTTPKASKRKKHREQVAKERAPKYHQSTLTQTKHSKTIEVAIHVAPLRSMSAHARPGPGASDIRSNCRLHENPRHHTDRGYACNVPARTRSRERVSNSQQGARNARLSPVPPEVHAPCLHALEYALHRRRDRRVRLVDLARVNSTVSAAHRFAEVQEPLLREPDENKRGRDGRGRGSVPHTWKLRTVGITGKVLKNITC